MSIGEDERALWLWQLRRRPRAPRRLPQQQFAAAAAIFSPSSLEEDRLKVREMKYVLVTGGVVSGLGKGVTASSIGVVLKACGLRVTSVKIGQFFEPPFLSFKMVSWAW
jgi:CTP synthase